MAATWQTPQVAMPVDGAVVWIVRLPFFDTPFQAQYFQIDTGLEWLDSNGFTHTIPVFDVFKWRDL
jgi:hypothetical protein